MATHLRLDPLDLGSSRGTPMIESGFKIEAQEGESGVENEVLAF